MTSINTFFAHVSLRAKRSEAKQSDFAEVILRTSVARTKDLNHNRSFTALRSVQDDASRQIASSLLSVAPRNDTIWVTNDIRHSLIVFFILFSFGLAGCKTIVPQNQSRQNQKQSEKDLESVAGALNGKSLTEEDLKRLKSQMRDNPEAQSAVQSITNSLDGKKRLIKYCPIDGERYAPSLNMCPNHHVALKVLEE